MNEDTFLEFLQDALRAEIVELIKTIDIDFVYERRGSHCGCCDSIQHTGTKSTYVDGLGVVGFFWRPDESCGQKLIDEQVERRYVNLVDVS